MAIRILKVSLTAIVAVMALILAVQNLLNMNSAYATVASVLAMEGHQAYPRSVAPAITAPALVWFALTVIIAAEIASGVLAGKGAWDLWRARKLPADQFDAAKTYSVVGCGAVILVWFGLFMVLAGGFFQMWQTDMGRGAMENSFQLAGMAGIVMLFVNTSDRDF